MTTKIRDIRKTRGLTLQALADRVGTTAQTIQRLETGTMTVSIDWLTRIGNALDLAPAQLLSGPLAPTIPVVGTLQPDGVVVTTKVPPFPPLRLDVVGPDPVAVVLGERLGPHEAGTVLVATRLAVGSERDADNRDCLVETHDGRLLFRRIVHKRGVMSAVQPYAPRATVDRDLAIHWLAPVVLAIRYL